MRKREGYPSLEDDKILDSLPDPEIEGLRIRERFPRGRPARHISRKEPRRFLRPVILVLSFLLGLGAGWFLHSAFSPNTREEGKEGGGISELFGYPFTGVRLEKSSQEKGDIQAPTILTLHPGETIRIKYAKESLRYLSLERRSSPWEALMALFLSPPVFYLEHNPLEPGVELDRFLQPEKTLSYTLALRPPDQLTPVATFQLELDMDARGWLSRARLLSDPQAKRKCLEKAAENEPSNGQILMALGKLLWEQKETDEAIKRFEQIQDGQPEHIEARKALATIYWKEEPEKALEIYRALARLDPEGRVEHYKQIARLQERLGVSPAETYRKILSVRKDDEDAIQGIEGLYAERIKRAQNLEKEGELEKAIREMKQAIEVQSTKEARDYLATLYNNLGYSLAKKGNHGEAIRNYEKSLFWNKNPVTYLNLADAYQRTKEFSKAERALQRAYALKPKDKEVSKSILLLWGELLMADKKYGEAVEKLEDVAKRSPKDPQIVKALGMAYWKKGDHAKALEVLEQLVALLESRPAQERAELYRLIGDLHRTMGDEVKDPKARIGYYDQALKSYEQAISLNGKDKEAQRRWEEAAEQRKALKIRILQSS